MSKKRPPTNRAAEPPRIDDLKLINGIGPKVEKRLNGVGIFTFAQLAALSPADIAAAVAGLSGLSAERIKKQDWIGQARKLAAESVTSEAHKNVEAPVAARPGLAGTLHLRDLKLTGNESAGSHRILSHEQPLDVHLVLDLSEMIVPGYTSLNYKASIYGKSRGSSSGLVVGEAEGTIKPGDTVTIDVKGNPLPEGTYRLAATAVLTLPGTKRTMKPGTLAVIDGGQVLVY